MAKITVRRRRISRVRMLRASRKGRLSRRAAHLYRRRQPPGERPVRQIKRNRRPAAEPAAGTTQETPPDVDTERRLSYEDGFRKGKYEGGERILARFLPDMTLLPDISVEHVISLGVEQVRHLLKPLMGVEEVFQELEKALQERAPCSLVRLGDGELLALAHDTVLSAELVRREGTFLEYSGMSIPDYAHRDQLAEAVRKASIIGVPVAPEPNFQGLLFPVFQAYGIQIAPRRFTLSTINYLLAEEGYLTRLIQGRRVLVIGNTAHSLAAVLADKGAVIAGAISPVKGIHDIPGVLEEAAEHDYDLAVVAAGIPAVILVQRLAEQFCKVAIDFGHLANLIVEGNIQIS
ncbi:GT-D fold domain-containing glycosyltransferase [Paenibacillus thiaminolyticus]|uniref:GT-D fold domain-containing glycosyltransferase n=1 Tax=Paenibacillus thiaminolyticus TaxID=49283 RepID=UPI0021758CFE|nr:GT-D fold domain-containing glycosyltransferase [Paenibacillus thiaminolyticus]